jgi:enoyl-CoA hydratase
MRLIEAVSEPGGAVPLALSWARDVARSAPGSVAAFKQLLDDVVTSAAARAQELELFVEAWASPDHHEAVEAFFEARPPVWGRTKT